MSRRKGITLALSLGVIITGLYAFRYLSGTHTEYCPLSHKLSDTSDCIVLQIKDGRVLIRHRDSFTKEAYFEIIENGRSQKFEIPDYKLKINTPKKFRVRLIDNEDSAVTINGERYELRQIADGSG